MGLHINDLPEEVIIYIFSYFCIKDLLKIQLVCKYWQKLCFDPVLRKSIDFHEDLQLVNESSIQKIINDSTSLEKLKICCRVDFDKVFTDVKCKTLLKLYVEEYFSQNTPKCPKFVIFLKTHTTITHLNIWIKELPQKIISAVGYLVNLKNLNLGKITDKRISGMCKIAKNCIHLESVTLKGQTDCSFAIDIYGKDLLYFINTKQRHLKEFILYQKVPVDILNPISLCRNLYCLKLCVSGNCDHLKVIRKLKNLNELYLRFYSSIDLNQLFDCKIWPNLKHLKIRHESMFGDIADSIAQTCTNLLTLKLAFYMNFKDQHFESIIKHCQHLHLLEINCEISNLFDDSVKGEEKVDNLAYVEDTETFPLKRLYLNIVSISLDFLSNILSEFSLLESLYLYYTTTADIQIYNMLKNCPKLQEIDIYNYKTPVLKSDRFSNTINNSSMKNIELTDGEITEFDLKQVVTMCKNLKYVSMYCCSITSSDNCMEELASSSLVTLNLTNLTIDEMLLKRLFGKCPNVQHLTIKPSQYITLDCISFLEKFPNLQKLSLEKFKLVAKSVDKVQIESYSVMEEIRLVEDEVCDFAVYEILQNCFNLKELYIQDTLFTDEDYSNCLRKCERLDDLWISNSEPFTGNVMLPQETFLQITRLTFLQNLLNDENLHHVLSKCLHLHELTLYNCLSITGSAFQKFTENPCFFCKNKYENVALWSHDFHNSKILPLTNLRTVTFVNCPKFTETALRNFCMQGKNIKRLTIEMDQISKKFSRDLQKRRKYLPKLQRFSDVGDFYKIRGCLI